MNAIKKILTKKSFLTIPLVLTALWPLPLMVNAQHLEYLFIFLLPGAWLYFIPAFTTFAIVFYCWWHVNGDRSFIYYFILLVLSASFFYGGLGYGLLIDNPSFFADVSILGQIGFWSVWAYFLFVLVLDYKDIKKKE